MDVLGATEMVWQGLRQGPEEAVGVRQPSVGPIPDPGFVCEAAPENGDLRKIIMIITVGLKTIGRELNDDVERVSRVCVCVGVRVVFDTNTSKNDSIEFEDIPDLDDCHKGRGKQNMMWRENRHAHTFRHTHTHIGTLERTLLRTLEHTFEQTPEHTPEHTLEHTLSTHTYTHTNLHTFDQTYTHTHTHPHEQTKQTNCSDADTLGSLDTDRHARPT